MSSKRTFWNGLASLIYKIFPGMRGKPYYAWLGISLLSILFTILSTVIIHSPWVFSAEEEIIRQLTSIKKELNQHVLRRNFYDPQFFEKNFLFINTASDYDLGKDKSSNELYFPGDRTGPTVPITDRKKLVDLFRWLLRNEQHIGYIFCDMVFEDSSAFNKKYDDSLGYYISLLQIRQKIVLAGVLGDGNTYRPGIFNIRDENKGIVNKSTVEDFFINYQLVHGTPDKKSFPLKMYEKINMVGISKGNWGFIKFIDSAGSSKRSFNTFIPEIVFDADYFSSLRSYSSSEVMDSTVCMINLGQATGDTAVLTALLEKKSAVKKMVFIGSFSSEHPDVHRTVYGDVNGSVIILNIYYGLLKGQTRYTLWLFVFLFFVFLAIFYWIFFHHREENKLSKQNIAGFLWKKLVLENRHYLLLFLSTVLCYLLFNRVLNIIILAALFVALETIIRIISEYRTRKIKDIQ